MLEMAHVERIRHLLYVKGKSQRQVAKILGISRRTVAKYKDHTTPPQFTRTKARSPEVMTPQFQAEVRRLLDQNQSLPRKQRWIGRTIFLALCEMGYQGS